MHQTPLARSSEDRRKDHALTVYKSIALVYWSKRLSSGILLIQQPDAQWFESRRENIFFVIFFFFSLSFPLPIFKIGVSMQILIKYIVRFKSYEHFH